MRSSADCNGLNGDELGLPAGLAALPVPKLEDGGVTEFPEGSVPLLLRGSCDLIAKGLVMLDCPANFSVADESDDFWLLAASFCLRKSSNKPCCFSVSAGATWKASELAKSFSSTDKVSMSAPIALSSSETVGSTDVLMGLVVS